jgi:HK97 family phage major capsid protein
MPTDREFVDDMKSTWYEYKAAVERKADQSTIDRLNMRLDALETMQKRVPLVGASAPNYDPPKEPNKEHQLFFKMVAARGPQGLEVASERAEAEALQNSISQKLYGMGERERKALALGDDTTGGFLAPPDLAQEIIKGIQLISPVRQYATVRQTVRRSVMYPNRSGVFSAAWVGETATRSETTGLTYSMEEIPTYEAYAEVIVSNQDLEDSAFDLAADITENAAEQFAKLEGTAFVAGTSLKQPEGFMTNSNVLSDLCAGAGALDAPSIVKFVYNLKSGYAQNAVMMMNRKTMGVVRGLVDGQQRFIWEPNYQVGTPQTVLGIPVVEVPDMDDVGSTKFPIAIGNFRRGYYIVDRIDMSIQRLNEKYAEQGQVAFLFRKRVGGQVVLPEAIRKLKSNNS